MTATIINLNVFDGAGKTQQTSFLDLLLKISEEYPDLMTDTDIREEVDTFLFEGHDTSSISITMTLLLLGIHPEIQVRSIQIIYRDLI